MATRSPRKTIKPGRSPVVLAFYFTLLFTSFTALLIHTMFSFTAVSALTLAALSLVNASPAVLKRSSHHCTPNFEGAPVSITFGDAELRIDANHNVVIDQLWVQKAEFRIENNGQANPGFIIKYVSVPQVICYST